MIGISLLGQKGHKNYFSLYTKNKIYMEQI
jgi:hypothetical protein